ncbi:MAG: TIR domain-containing protein, partial [Chloroflexi bacterium]|nr:TIR domain-containing protein [Chloroflexota bacterium]
MAHDVFISYASEDKITADAVCAGLEKAGIRCWIAPRDILTSENYDDAIIKAINASKVMVVIFSAYIFQSQFVKSEVERAFSKGLIIAPFRIENIDPQGGLELYLGTKHWLDAMTPPLENHIQTLVTSIQPMLVAVAAVPVELASSPVPATPVAAGPVSSPQPAAPKTRRLAGLHIALASGGLIGILCLGVVLFLVGKNFLDNFRKQGTALPGTAAQSLPIESAVPTPPPVTPAQNPSSDTPQPRPAQPGSPASAVANPTLPGVSWLYLVDLPRNINAFVVDPANPKIVYAASADYYTSSGGGVYKSEDAGLSWRSTSSGLPNRTAQALVLIPGAVPALLAAVGNDIYASRDGAASWTKAGNTGTYSGNATNMFAVSGDARTVFAVVNELGIARS